MAAEINKAVVPEDYARLIHTLITNRLNTLKNSSTNKHVVTHDLTLDSSDEDNIIDVHNLPSYDIVGEIKCIYPKGTLESITPFSDRNYETISNFKIDPKILYKYRLIRLIVQPNFYAFISSNKLTLRYSVQLSINDSNSTTYKSPSIQISNAYGPQTIVDYTTKLAFIFDTKTKEFYKDTNGTTLWSDIYNIQTISEVEEDI
jgi:hypothetical protein